MTMNNGKKWIGLLIVLVVGAAALGGGWYLRHRRTEQQCWVCKRPIHADNKVIAELDGRRHETCCPACVLAMRAQTHKKVRMVSVTDYLSRQPIEPAQASFVVGSDVDTCGQHGAPAVGEDMRDMQVHFDRCRPSIVAFRNRQDADAFVGQHGGKIGSLAELGMTP